MTRSASATARATAARVAGQRHDAALVDLVDPAEAIEVLVEQQHLGLHALRDPRRVPPDVAGAEHHDARRPHAGCAAHEDARARRGAVRGSARRPAEPCGPRPRSSARAAGARRARGLHGLVRDTGGARVEQRVGDVGVRREVQVREQREVRGAGTRTRCAAVPSPSSRCRRGPTPLRRSATISAPTAAVVVVGDARVDAGAALDRRRSTPWFAISCTPSGVIATRCSSVFTSLGTPTVITRGRQPSWPRQ